MTSAIFQLVYMPNFRAIGQSVWEKNGREKKRFEIDRYATETQNTETHRDLNFIKIDMDFSFLLV